MDAWIDPLNAISATWLDLLFRASWQGGIALAVVWLIARFVSRLPAAHKVWLWRLAFFKLLAGLIWLSPVLLPILPQQTPSVPVVSETIPMTPAQAEAADDLPQPAQVTVPAMTIAPTPSRLPFRTWLFLAWCAALFACTLRVLRHWRDTQRLLRGSRPLSNGVLEECVRALTEGLHLRRPPSISESPAVPSPVLLGIFRPRIILPRGLADSVSPSRLDLMLAHELAHLRRRDLLWLWFFTLGETLFFFHPLVWLARREWNLATEAACDEMAIRLTRQTPRDYGEMLVDIVAATSRNATPLVAVGIIENANTLKRRLKLMSTTRTRLASIGGIALISMATLFLVPWKLTAQDADIEAVAKLKEENAKLRQELEVVRRDAEKMRSDVERMRNPAVAGRQREAALQREAAERENQFAREQAWNVERDKRDIERIRVEHQRQVEHRQAELEELRTQFTENHPRVRQVQAQIEQMEELRAHHLQLQADLDQLRTKFSNDHPEVRNREVALVKIEARMAALQDASQARLSLKPSSRTKTAYVPATERAIKHHEQQRALLQKELELVEREMEMTRKNVEAGVQSRSALLAAQREVLEVKLQIAGLSANKDDARAVIKQQIEIANKMLKEHKQLVERGVAAVGSEVQLEREVLRLTRKLYELDGPDADQ